MQLSRELNVQYKTAFVLAHKIRESLAAESNGHTVAGEIEIDGLYVGGHVRPANFKENRVDRRRAEHQTGKRRVVVVMRERNGKTLPFVFPSEDASLATIKAEAADGRTGHAYEATHWDPLHGAAQRLSRLHHARACRSQAP